MIMADGILARAILLEPLSLFYRFNRDFLLFATIVADAPFLDVPKPFSAVAICICAEGFKNGDPSVASFTFWRHSLSSPFEHLIETT